MIYYKQTDNYTIQMLMEILEEEARKNPVWTLQGLFALCRDVSLLDDVPENADYFDEIYLTIAELFSEFNRYGRLIDVPDALKKVCGFTTDEAAKNELLSALDALHSGTIQGRTRSLTAKWEAKESGRIGSGTLRNCGQRLQMFCRCRHGLIWMRLKLPLRETGEKKKGGKVMKAVFLVFSLLFAWLALYLFLQGAGAIFRTASLRIQGIKTTAEVTQVVAAVTQPRRTNSFRETVRYTHYEVVRFQTEDGLEVEGRLPEKTFSDKTYSVKTNIDDWKEIVVATDIKVTDGKCTVGLYSDAHANEWVQMDNVRLVKI